MFLLVALVATAHLPLLGQTCGGQERWPVKVGSDSRAAEVDVAHPIPISLHDLVNITRPQIPNGDDNRVDAETKVYTIDAHLVKFQSESGRDGDGDYHLVISDDTLLFTQGGTHSPASPHSFVGEIPKPERVPGRNGDPSTQSVFQTHMGAKSVCCAVEAMP